MLSGHVVGGGEERADRGSPQYETGAVASGDLESLNGIEITRQANARWEEEFSPRVDPFNRTYYWLTGRFVNLDDSGDNDLAAIDRGYVSVTPLRLDLTAYDHIDTLRSWEWVDS